MVSRFDKDQAPKQCPKPNIYQKILMAIAWWSSHDSIHYSFLKSGQSITAVTYCNELDHMMKNLAEKQPRLVNKDGTILLHDNTHPHATNRTQFKILELDLETIDHPPHSLDLSPTTYHLLRNLDNLLEGKIFNSQKAVENAFCAFIESRSADFYEKGINELALEIKIVSLPQEHTLNN